MENKHKELQQLIKDKEQQLFELSCEVSDLESKLSAIKEQELELLGNVFEKEFLQLKEEFEKAKEYLYIAERKFGECIRILVPKWQELRDRARQKGSPFPPSKLPFSHRVNRFGIDVSVRFKDNRDHIFRISQ